MIAKALDCVMVQTIQVSPGRRISNVRKYPEKHTRQDGGSRDSVFDGGENGALWGFYRRRRVYEDYSGSINKKRRTFFKFYRFIFDTNSS